MISKQSFSPQPHPYPHLGERYSPKEALGYASDFEALQPSIREDASFLPENSYDVSTVLEGSGHVCLSCPEHLQEPWTILITDLVHWFVRDGEEGFGREAEKGSEELPVPAVGTVFELDKEKVAWRFTEVSSFPAVYGVVSSVSEAVWGMAIGTIVVRSRNDAEDISEYQLAHPDVCLYDMSGKDVDALFPDKEERVLFITFTSPEEYYDSLKSPVFDEEYIKLSSTDMPVFEDLQEGASWDVVAGIDLGMEIPAGRTATIKKILLGASPVILVVFRDIGVELPRSEHTFTRGEYINAVMEDTWVNFRPAPPVFSDEDIKLSSAEELTEGLFKYYHYLEALGQEKTANVLPWVVGSKERPYLDVQSLLQKHPEIAEEAPSLNRMGKVRIMVLNMKPNAALLASGETARVGGVVYAGPLLLVKREDWQGFDNVEWEEVVAHELPHNDHFYRDKSSIQTHADTMSYISREKEGPSLRSQYKILTKSQGPDGALERLHGHFQDEEWGDEEVETYRSKLIEVLELGEEKEAEASEAEPFEVGTFWMSEEDLDIDGLELVSISEPSSIWFKAGRKWEIREVEPAGSEWRYRVRGDSPRTDTSVSFWIESISFNRYMVPYREESVFSDEDIKLSAVTSQQKKNQALYKEWLQEKGRPKDILGNMPVWEDLREGDFWVVRGGSQPSSEEYPFWVQNKVMGFSEDRVMVDVRNTYIDVDDVGSMEREAVSLHKNIYSNDRAMGWWVDFVSAAPVFSYEDIKLSSMDMPPFAELKKGDRWEATFDFKEDTPKNGPREVVSVGGGYISLKRVRTGTVEKLGNLGYEDLSNGGTYHSFVPSALEPVFSDEAIKLSAKEDFPAFEELQEGDSWDVEIVGTVFRQSSKARVVGREEDDDGVEVEFTETIETEFDGTKKDKEDSVGTLRPSGYAHMVKSDYYLNFRPAHPIFDGELLKLSYRWDPIGLGLLPPSPVTGATLQHKTLRITYTNLGDGQTKTRVVEPHYVFDTNTTNRRMLLTWCRQADNWRMFCLEDPVGSKYPGFTVKNVGKKFKFDAEETKEKVKTSLLQQGQELEKKIEEGPLDLKESAVEPAEGQIWVAKEDVTWKAGDWSEFVPLTSASEVSITMRKGTEFRIGNTSREDISLGLIEIERETLIGEWVREGLVSRDSFRKYFALKEPVFSDEEIKLSSIESIREGLVLFAQGDISDEDFKGEKYKPWSYSGSDATIPWGSKKIPQGSRWQVWNTNPLSMSVWMKDLDGTLKKGQLYLFSMTTLRKHFSGEVPVSEFSEDVFKISEHHIEEDIKLSSDFFPPYEKLKTGDSWFADFDSTASGKRLVLSGYEEGNGLVYMREYMSDGAYVDGKLEKDSYLHYQKGTYKDFVPVPEPVFDDAAIKLSATQDFPLSKDLRLGDSWWVEGILTSPGRWLVAEKNDDGWFSMVREGDPEKKKGWVEDTAYDAAVALGKTYKDFVPAPVSFDEDTFKLSSMVYPSLLAHTEEGEPVDLDFKGPLANKVTLNQLEDLGLPGDHLHMDYANRDYTINALYLDLQTGQVLDPGGSGLQDLQERVLRTVLDPDEAVKLHPLLILRGVRMAVQFDCQPLPEVASAWKDHQDLLESIPEDRRRYEYAKMKSFDPEKAEQTVRQYGLEKWVGLS